MTPYSDVLDSIEPVDDGWSTTVPDDWAQGRTVFGGMQVALMVRAMRAARGTAPLPPLRSLQATFVGPLPTGRPVLMRAETLRTGRSATHVRCDLVHSGSLACTAVAIFGAARPSRVAVDIAKPVPPVGPDAITDPSGLAPEFARHMQLRWAAGSPPYSGQDHASSLIYARLADPRCSAEDALIALADAPPTPSLSMLTTPAPASSVNWMLEFIGDPRLLDRARWALIGTEVRAGADGYLSQTSVLWGPDGHAFTVSHQTVAIYG